MRVIVLIIGWTTAVAAAAAPTETILFGLEQGTNLVDNILIRCHVQIHQWLERFLAVFILGKLKRYQWIDIDQTQIQTIWTDRSKVWIRSG